MARIAYADVGQLEPDAAAILGTVRDSIDAASGADMKDDEVPYIFRALVHSPPSLEAIWTLLGNLWGGTQLDRQLQELVILRVAQVRRSDYEWGRHRRAAEHIGVPDSKVDALERFADAPELTDAERAAIGLVDVLAREGDAPQSAIDAALEHFSERQLVELTLFAGAYVMVATFLAALRIDQEPNDPRLPPVAAASPA
jgi:alkylhydroperoxidase family enzyme